MINPEIEQLFQAYSNAAARYNVGDCTKNERDEKHKVYLIAYNKALPQGVRCNE